MKKIKSLGELRALARTDPRYVELALAAARNLGGAPASLDRAFAWLSLNADETSEAGVVREINFCLPLLAKGGGR